MKKKLILLFKLVNRFGLRSGTIIFYQNLGTKGMLSFRLKNFTYPLFLRKSTTDFLTFYHVFFDLEYKIPLNFTPEFIVDCGANIGLASLYLKMAYPGSKIIAVEPEQSNYEMLLKNTEKYPDIECVKMGIWNRNAILRVEDEYNMGKWGFVCREVDVEEKDTVRAISIDEIMCRYKKQEIDILKIDIETTELELFSSNYENWLPKTKVIIIELHDWLRKGCAKSFFTALIKYDFSIYRGVGENMVCVRN